MDPHIPCRLAIFDFDGTLSDSLPWFIRVLDDVAARHRFRRVDDDLAVRLRTMETQAILKELGIPLWKVPAIARDLRRRKLEAVPPVPLFAGVREMLEGLKGRGTTVAIVSSDSEGSVRRTLGAEIASLVSHFNCSASIFGKAAKLRQVASQSRQPTAGAIYIGDETRDAEAAAKAGLRFGAVTWGYSTRAALLAHRPAFVFDTLAEIVGALHGAQRPEAARLVAARPLLAAEEVAE
ncbi:phosphoglycolate phosphatase [Aureimonas endophytica]|uniref:Phosphoglycolate phosphatase n=1 Tax=Aureimonas endophytica TaxID=2027858 RepID=A0A917E3A0_9HYPH|nr:HAD hydrolase-like protein [Aureimonas endophytica]GGD96722.1 phosphoglycolate phosphatase [Aureimonas endophytica]